jgi:hypothetical protein
VTSSTFGPDQLYIDPQWQDHWPDGMPMEIAKFYFLPTFVWGPKWQQRICQVAQYVCKGASGVMDARVDPYSTSSFKALLGGLIVQVNADDNSFAIYTPADPYTTDINHDALGVPELLGRENDLCYISGSLQSFEESAATQFFENELHKTGSGEVGRIALGCA